MESHSPKSARLQYSTDCPSVCTDAMIPDGKTLTVIATSGHAHQFGTAVKMDLVPKGRAPSLIFDDTNFDFDLQQLTPCVPVST